MPAAHVVQTSTRGEEHRDHLRSRRGHFTTAFACLIQPLVIGLAVVLASPSHAGLLVTIQESGSNVTATLSGSFATLPTPSQTGVSPSYRAYFQPKYFSSSIFYANTTPSTTDPEISNRYAFDQIFPSFGVTGPLEADTTTVNTRLGFFDDRLFLPQAYTLGTPFTGAMTWNNASIASLGLTPGVYSSSLTGGDAGATVTINVVPEPTSVALLAIGAVGILGWRRIARPTAGISGGSNLSA